MQLWKSYSVKLDESLQLNRKNAEDITHERCRSFPLFNATAENICHRCGCCVGCCLQTALSFVF